MAREIRVVFNDKEEKLYNFVKSKCSASGYLKDLATLEMKREENYTNNSNLNDIEKIADILASKIGKLEIIKSNADDKNSESEFDFDINDLD